MFFALFGVAFLVGVGARSLNSTDYRSKFASNHNTIGLPLYYVGNGPNGELKPGFRYTIPISVGTPRQEFKTYLDMQSADTWVAYKTCQSLENKCSEKCSRECSLNVCTKECCRAGKIPANINNKFDNATSSSFRRLRDGWLPQGEYDGFYGQETVSFGTEQDLDVVKIPSSSVEFATLITDGIGNGVADGSFGLAFANRSTNGDTTVWENAFQQKIFAHSLFTLFLEREDPKTLGDYAGALTFGAAWDCSSENVKYFKLFQDGNWGFSFDGTLLNGKPLLNKPFRAIIDINSPLILVPTNEMDLIVEQLNAKFDFKLQLYTVDCNIAPFKWGFQANGNTVEIDSKGFLVKTVGDKCVLTFNTNWGPDSDPDYVIGIPFMKQFCGVFDYTQKTIGFTTPYYENN